MATIPFRTIRANPFRVIGRNGDRLLRGQVAASTNRGVSGPDVVPGASRVAPPRPHILVTETDGDVRGLLATILEGEGYRVSFSATQDVAELMVDPPDLLLIDEQGSPNDSGWAFLERLKANRATASIPALVLSGERTGTAAHAPRLAKLDTVRVFKPFDLDDLIAQIRHRLAGDPA
jgi:CheY-like chemotaxis protein